MKGYLQRIDTNTSGNRNDVTPLFADRAAFAQLSHDLAAPFLDARIDVVAGIDALGFILGTAIAERLDVGVVTIRKGGKLPVETVRESFVDYSGKQKTLEIRPDVLAPGAEVLIVDEWIETGAQVCAAIALVKRLGGIVAGIATIRVDRNDRTDGLRRDFQLHSVWKDDI